MKLASLVPDARLEILGGAKHGTDTVYGAVALIRNFVVTPVRQNAGDAGTSAQNR